MPFFDEQNTDITLDTVQGDTELPSGYSTKSFKIDFENGRILSQLTDLPETVRQQATIAIMTERGVHTVLGDDFGAQIRETIATAPTSEVAALEIDEDIRDALVDDLRISDVTNIVVERVGGDKAQVYVEIDVDGELVTVEQEV